MFEFDGKEFKKLALHGGGTPIFGHYIGLFDSIHIFDKLESFNIPLVTSSAGSMVVLYYIAKYIDKKCNIESIFNIVEDEIGNVLENIYENSIITFEFLRVLFEKEFAQIYSLTFRDLKKISPNMEWTVCCSKYRTYEFSSYGTHTPDVVIWKACLASMCLPIIFPPIEINGNLYCDGDLSDWVKHLNIINDTDFLHIRTLLDPTNIPFGIHTNIPLLDEAIKLLAFSMSKMFTKTQPVHGVYRIDFIASIQKNFLSEEFIESGKKMSRNFILK
jgi:hypothetical protein